MRLVLAGVLVTLGVMIWRADAQQNEVVGGDGPSSRVSEVVADDAPGVGGAADGVVTADGATAGAGGSVVPSGPPPTTVVGYLEEIQRTNTALIEKQERLIEELEVLKEDARQTRIFSKRS